MVPASTSPQIISSGAFTNTPTGQISAEQFLCQRCRLSGSPTSPRGKHESGVIWPILIHRSYILRPPQSAYFNFRHEFCPLFCTRVQSLCSFSLLVSAAPHIIFPAELIQRRLFIGAAHQGLSDQHRVGSIFI